MEARQRCPRRSGAARRARGRARRQPTLAELVTNAQRELIFRVQAGQTVVLTIRGEVVRVYEPKGS